MLHIRPLRSDSLGAVQILKPPFSKWRRADVGPTTRCFFFRAFADRVHKCTAHPRNQSYVVPLGCIAPFPHAMLPRTSIPLALQRPQPSYLGNARHPRPCTEDNLANNLSRSLFPHAQTDRSTRLPRPPSTHAWPSPSMYYSSYICPMTINAHATPMPRACA